MYARTTPNPAYLSSTFEELLMRKCSCSLKGRVSSATSQRRGTLELVNQVLSACLHSLGLDALDHLEGNFSSEEGIAARSASFEYVNLRVLCQHVSGTHPSQLRPAAGARIKFLWCTVRRKTGCLIDAAYIIGPRATLIPFPLNSAPMAAPRARMRVRLKLYFCQKMERLSSRSTYVAAALISLCADMSE